MIIRSALSYSVSHDQRMQPSWATDITNTEIIMKDKNHIEDTHFHNEVRLSERLSMAFFKMSFKSTTIKAFREADDRSCEK